jgi:hypothetical protein
MKESPSSLAAPGNLLQQSQRSAALCFALCDPTQVCTVTRGSATCAASDADNNGGVRLGAATKLLTCAAFAHVVC